MYQKTKGKIVIKFSIIWFLLLIIIIGLAYSFFKNKIFATNEYKEEKQNKLNKKVKMEKYKLQHFKNIKMKK